MYPLHGAARTGDVAALTRLLGGETDTDLWKLARELSVETETSGASDTLSEGDKVEADYRGRGKFYPGNITRDRGDDTYDISYDDGELETRVAKHLIKSKAGG